MLWLGLHDDLELLGHRHVITYLNTRNLALFKQIDDQVEQGDHVISPTRGIELELARWREIHIASEDLFVLLLNVLPALLFFSVLKVPRCVSEIYQCHARWGEEVEVGRRATSRIWCVLILVLAADLTADHQVVKLEVIIHVACRVYFFKNIDELKWK